MTQLRQRAALSCSVLAATIVGAVLIPTAANAHGYVGTPDRDPSSTALTARVAIAENAANQYETPWNTPQGMEAPKGFPAVGPKDGQLASAGQPGASVLDEQSEDRWVKNEVDAGADIDVDWTFTMGHKTSQWRYFMTKDGWNPNDRLEREDLELIETVAHDGSEAGEHRTHELTIPSDRDGYHVIYAVWDVADTANAFYNVIDVDVHGDNGEPEEPETPDTERPSNVTAVYATVQSPTKTNIQWAAATDNVGVDHYEIFLNGVLYDTVPGNQRQSSITGITPGTMYTFTVHAVDAAGNAGGSKIGAFKTVADEEHTDTENPTAPKSLHAMDVTATTVDLMWGKATDNTAVTEYKIWDARAGKFIAATSKTSITIEGLSPESVNAFTIYAFDAAGNMSSSSNILVVTTEKDADAGSDLPTWDPFAKYTKGDKVTFDGQNYIAVSSYQGVGDPSWISALSLWNTI